MLQDASGWRVDVYVGCDGGLLDIARRMSVMSDSCCCCCCCAANTVRASVAVAASAMALTCSVGKCAT
jgi:hypothetical protein